MNKHLYQRGSAHIVIIICLVLALVTTLGWVFYQNFIYKETPNKDTDLIVVEKKDDSPDKSKDTNEQDSEDFLAISSWNVKFKLPSSLQDTKVSYEMLERQSGTGEVYGFITDRMKKAGCSLGNYGADIVWKDSKSHKGEIDTIPLNDNQPIDGSYYATIGARSSCGDESSQSDIDADRKALQDMFLSIESTE
ncbi:MAG TPA: hypothetical protein VGE13_01210 [Candidatus Saccharimonadales bacterium]